MAGLYNSNRNLTGVGTALSKPAPNKFQDFMSNVGNFFTSDMAPVALGMGAQAVMGKHQDDWRAGLGRSVVELQRSKIAAKAATRQAEERRALIRLLSGKANTAADKPGPSKVGLTVTPEGQTIKIDGINMVDGIFGEGSGGGASRPVTAPAPAATTPQGTPSGPTTGSLPLALAQTVGSSGGTGQSLAGLTPEQIGGVARRDMMGGELGNRSVSDIFSNMQKQAQADYYGRLPQSKEGANRLEMLKLQLKARRDAAMNARDYATVNKLNKELSMIDPEFALKSETQGALTTRRGAETNRIDQQVGARELLMESGIGAGDANVGAMLAAGGSAGSIAGARSQEFEQAENIAMIKSKLLTENKDLIGASSSAQLINNRIAGTTPTFVYFDRKGDNEWREVRLPWVDGKRMTMQDVRNKAAAKHVTVEVFLDFLYNNLKKRNELEVIRD